MSVSYFQPMLLPWINDVLNLFFPRNCQLCSHPLHRQEEVLCLMCQAKLPKTGFEQHEDNPVSEVFWGRVNLKSATSFLFFSKGGSAQHLIHLLKYKNRKETGIYLGKLFGVALKESPFFQTVDIIIPVPLHPKKERLRGYNQSDYIATGLGQSMERPVEKDNLVRVVHTTSQTKKSRYDRWKNVKGIFAVSNPEPFRNKHILLVDDVLTTGATLEACASVLLEIDNVKVSAATLAYSQG